MTNETVKENVCKREAWCRLLYMILFGIVFYVVLMLLGLVIVVQFIFTITTGASNQDIRQFGAHLAHYINQIVLFLTYNENRRPYPFNPLYEEADDELDEEDDDESADSYYTSAEQSGDGPTQLENDDSDKPLR